MDGLVVSIINDSHVLSADSSFFMSKSIIFAAFS